MITENANPASITQLGPQQMACVPMIWYWKEKKSPDFPCPAALEIMRSVSKRSPHNFLSLGLETRILLFFCWQFLLINKMIFKLSKYVGGRAKVQCLHPKCRCHRSRPSQELGKPSPYNLLPEENSLNTS